jgi:hypothetical protein
VAPKPVVTLEHDTEPVAGLAGKYVDLPDRRVRRRQTLVDYRSRQAAHDQIMPCTTERIMQG